MDLDTENFIKKAINIHNNKYEYSKVFYVNAKTKIDIICPEHGIFKQTPNSHLNGIGCYYCGVLKRTKNKTYTKEKFIEKAKSIHGNKYDYSKVKYKKSDIKIKINCFKHGVFEQTPSKHLIGRGCTKCANENISKKRLGTKEKFLKQVPNSSKLKYDYSLVKYKGNNVKVKIICPEHGVFKQTPTNHIQNKGCSKCGIKNRIRKRRTSEAKKFIKKAKNIHSNKYDYSKIDYVNCNKTVIIKCFKHGVFKQTPHSHLNGNGCQICNESKGERDIRNFLIENKISFESQKKFKKCKNKYLLPFDFHLPKHNLLIEYDGRQHFKPIEYFGGEEEFNHRKENDNIKNRFARDNNINLLRISYKDKKNINEILKNHFI